MTADVVDLADRRFQRDALPAVDYCRVLIEECVLAGVADPDGAALAIYIGTVGYLVRAGCPADVLRAEIDLAIAAGLDAAPDSA
jgi:hypothetical protein